MTREARIDMLARASGTTPSTVSAMLLGLPVQPDARERIIAAARAHDMRLSIRRPPQCAECSAAARADSDARRRAERARLAELAAMRAEGEEAPCTAI